MATVRTIAFLFAVGLGLYLVSLTMEVMQRAQVPARLTYMLEAYLPPLPPPYRAPEPEQKPDTIKGRNRR